MDTSMCPTGGLDRWRPTDTLSRLCPAPAAHFAGNTTSVSRGKKQQQQHNTKRAHTKMITDRLAVWTTNPFSWSNTILPWLWRGRPPSPPRLPCPCGVRCDVCPALYFLFWPLFYSDMMINSAHKCRVVQFALSSSAAASRRSRGCTVTLPPSSGHTWVCVLVWRFLKMSVVLRLLLWEETSKMCLFYFIRTKGLTFVFIIPTLRKVVNYSNNRWQFI